MDDGNGPTLRSQGPSIQKDLELEEVGRFTSKSLAFPKENDLEMVNVSNLQILSYKYIVCRYL